MKSILKLKDLQELQTVRYYYVKTFVEGKTQYLISSGSAKGFSVDFIKIYKKSSHAKAALKSICNSMRYWSYSKNGHVDDLIRYSEEALVNAEICSFSMDFNDSEPLDKEEVKRYADLAREITEKHFATAPTN
jgi:hypothetical protein